MDRPVGWDCLHTYGGQGVEYNTCHGLILLGPHSSSAPQPRAFVAGRLSKLISLLGSPLHTTTIMAAPSSSTPSNSPHPMPPASADLATTWAFLEEGVDHIMTKLQTGVSYSKYMSLYTVAYNYCTSSRMHGAPDSAVSAGNRSE